MINKSVLVIIGNGISGITAAREARKLAPEMTIKIISQESRYFYSRTALMYIYMGHMRERETEVYERKFYKKNKLDLVFDTVEKIDVDKCKLQLKDSGDLGFDYLLIATGSRPNFFNWPGQDSAGVQGMYSLQDLYKLEKISSRKNNIIKKAVIVGGGLIGIELAEMLHSRHIPVQFLIREASYWDNILPPEESEIINQEIQDHGIGLSKNTQLKKIEPDQAGHVAAVHTDSAGRIECQFVGITTGVSPNIEIVKNSKIKTARGILVDEFMRTSIPGIYAAGDCVQFIDSDGRPGHLEQLWYTGKMHGAIAGHQIAADFLRSCSLTDRADQVDVSGYNRGVWFNSAKFFTIEYQTYGYVPAKLDAQNTYVWVSENGKQLIRLVWKKNSQGHNIVTGMNSLGIRFRQITWFEWISNQVSVDEVIRRLDQAVFDPEFFSSHVKKIQMDYSGRFDKKQGAVA